MRKTLIFSLLAFAILCISPPAVNAAENLKNAETLKLPDLDTGPDAMILIEATLDTGPGEMPDAIYVILTPEVAMDTGPKVHRNYIDYICTADPAITSASETAEKDPALVQIE